MTKQKMSRAKRTKIAKRVKSKRPSVFTLYTTPTNAKGPIIPGRRTGSVKAPQDRIPMLIDRIPAPLDKMSKPRRVRAPIDKVRTPIDKVRVLIDR